MQRKRLLLSTKLRNHVMVLRLARNLDEQAPEALGRLIGFLWWVIANEPSGDLSSIEDWEFAEAMGWRGDPSQAVQALIRAGFITERDGIRSVFDWNDWKSGLYKVATDRLGSTIWKRLQAQVHERDNYTCRYCGSHGGELHVDHVTPISRGGTDELANLVTACASCNLAKHNKTPEEWLA